MTIPTSRVFRALWPIWTSPQTDKVSNCYQPGQTGWDRLINVRFDTKSIVFPRWSFQEKSSFQYKPNSWKSCKILDKFSFKRRENWDEKHRYSGFLSCFLSSLYLLNISVIISDVSKVRCQTSFSNKSDYPESVEKCLGGQKLFIHFVRVHSVKSSWCSIRCGERIMQIGWTSIKSENNKCRYFARRSFPASSWDQSPPNLSSTLSTITANV